MSSYCVPSFVLGAGEESAKCRSIFQEGQPGNQHPQQVVVVVTRTRTKGDRGAGVTAHQRSFCEQLIFQQKLGPREEGR